MADKKIRTLLITGRVTDEHDPRMNQMLRFILEQSGRFDVKITEEFKGATKDTLDGYDLLFINYDGKESVEKPYVGWGENTERVVYDNDTAQDDEFVHMFSFVCCNNYSKRH